MKPPRPAAIAIADRAPARPLMVCDPRSLAYMHGMDERTEGIADAARRQRSAVVTLWLILAAIFVHALLPVGSPIDRNSGSAFSAATSDVSLAPGRAATLAQEGRQDDLDGGDPPSWPAVLAATSPAARVPAPAAALPPAGRAGLAPSPPGSPPYASRAPPLT